jgi:hypothetical protein
MEELPGIENGPLPPWRLGGTLMPDTSDGTMLLYQGNCDPTCGGVWRERLEVIEHEDGTIERRLVWDETPVLWPPDRMSAGTMVADPLGRGTLMHGGAGDSTGLVEPNDTWLWKYGDWTELETENAPPRRQAPSIAVHRRTNTVVSTGGLVGYDKLETSTWVLDGTRWEELDPAVSPPGRYHAAMAEERNGNVVLFGGLTLGTPQVRLGDTWVWDGEAWTQHTGPGPSARVYPQMVYDPVRRETVLFGGHGGGTGLPFSDIWLWRSSL